MDDGYGPVGTVDGPQQREGYRVVSAEGDDAGQRLATLCGTLLGRGRGRGPREDAVVAVLDLLQRVGIVVRGDRNVAAVQNGRPAVERVRVERYVVAATEPGKLSLASPFPPGPDPEKEPTRG